MNFRVSIWYANRNYLFYYTVLQISFSRLQQLFQTSSVDTASHAMFSFSVYRLTNRQQTFIPMTVSL